VERKDAADGLAEGSQGTSDDLRSVIPGSAVESIDMPLLWLLTERKEDVRERDEECSSPKSSGMS